MCDQDVHAFGDEVPLLQQRLASWEVKAPAIKPGLPAGRESGRVRAAPGGGSGQGARGHRSGPMPRSSGQGDGGARLGPAARWAAGCRQPSLPFLLWLNCSFCVSMTDKDVYNLKNES